MCWANSTIPASKYTVTIILKSVVTFRSLCLILVIADLAFSLYQHLQMPLDGDMAGIILPSAWYSRVLEDPFGISVWNEGASYAATNRFFVHFAMSGYFKSMPFLLQYCCDPINSIYWTAAIFKTIVQAGVIGLLSLLVGQVVKNRKDFWLIALLITPLFQTFGYNIMMGIIEKSITYTFFYAFPCCLFLLAIYLFYSVLNSTPPKQTRYFVYPALIVLLVILPFSGPLIPAIGILLAGLFIGKEWHKSFQNETGNRFTPIISAFRKIPARYILITMLCGALSAYSVWIGWSNIENGLPAVDLFTRYQRLPSGLLELLTTKIGFPLLLLLTGINLWLIQQRKDHPDRQKIMSVGKMLGLFIILYLLILPLGGYREYRPLIIRRDTFLPVTITLVFMYAMTTYWLLRHLPFKQKYLYPGVVVAFLLNFTLVDVATKIENECEKKALSTIASSKEAVVSLPTDCTILAWEKITDSRESETNALMLQYWGITNEKKLYFQK
jgi:hypothetical protein